MVKDSVEKVKRLVNGLSNLIPNEDMQRILVELGVIEGYFTRLNETKEKRVHFPKHFSIETDRDYIKLQEVTPSLTCYCSDSQYDTVVDAVINMQKRGEDFNRFSLLKETNTLDTEVTTPAILACLHYWLSMNDPLLSKEGDMFKISGTIDDFKDDAYVAWNRLDKKDLFVPKTGKR